MRRRAGWFAAAAALAAVVIVLAKLSRSESSAVDPPAVHATGDIELVTVGTVLDGIGKARAITLAAFVLNRDSTVVRRLEDAADHGARVSVALARGFGLFYKENAETASDLSSHGVRVHIVVNRDAPTHIKVAVLDGQVYLSDRNWTTDSREEIVVRDTIPGDRILMERSILEEADGNDHLWTRKSDALAAEAALLHTPHSHRVLVSSESFGPGTQVYDELANRREAGDEVDLLIAASEYERSKSEQMAVKRLAGLGANVRLDSSNEKMAIDGDSVWFGSANATRGLPDQIDFGIVVADESIARQLSRQFFLEWAKARPLTVA